MQKAAKYVAVLLKLFRCRLWPILVLDMAKMAPRERCGEWLIAFSEYVGEAGNIGKAL